MQIKGSTDGRACRSVFLREKSFFLKGRIMDRRYLSRVACFLSFMVVFVVAISFAAGSKAVAGEIEIGVEELPGGIELIFEAAPADTLSPSFMHLPESETEVHFEVRANFGSDNDYASAEGGFVPYLNVNVLVKNRVTGDALQITLTPHMNLVDGFHYARNVDLPGDAVSDSFDLTFFVEPPGEFGVQIHSDFRVNVNDEVIDGAKFEFENVNFSEVFVGGASGSG